MHWLLFGLLTFFVVNGIRRMSREGGAAPAPFPSEAQHKSEPKIDVQETVQCPKCNAYVTRGAPPCDRSDCPQGGL